MLIPRRKPFFNHNIVKSILCFYRDNTGSKQTEISKLEKKLSEELKIPNSVVLSSGRAGLQLILQNAQLREGSEIIIPSYTFGILVDVIKNAGFVPKPTEIDMSTCQIDIDKIKDNISAKTKAIIATHLFGEPCNIGRIIEIAKKHKLYVIEDCAQSLGAISNKKPVVTFGNISFSSFNIAKPLQGISGGIVFGKDKKTIHKIRKTVEHSEYSKSGVFLETFKMLFGYFLTQTILWFVLMFILSYKIPQKIFVIFYRQGELRKTDSFLLHPLFAKVIRSNLDGFNKRTIRRRQIRSLYKMLLKKYMVFLKVNKNDKGTVDMLIAKVPCDVLKLRGYLAVRGIDIGIKNEIADDISNKPSSQTSRFVKNLISLPIYETMTNKEIIYVCHAIIGYIKGI